MNILLFIPSLLEGDISGFMTKMAVVVLMWLVVIAASMIDLITGVAASRRTGQKKTTSWGLRRTLSKDLQYLAMLMMFLIIDICLSALSPYLALLSTPILSVVGTAAIVIVEAISVIENTRKGKDKKQDKIDDIQQLVVAASDKLGLDKTREVLEALQEYVEQQKKS